MKKNKSFLIILLALVAIQTMAIGQAADAKAAAATGGWEFPKIMGWVLGVSGAAIALIAMGFMLKVNQILYRKLLVLESEKKGFASARIL